MTFESSILQNEVKKIKKIYNIHNFDYDQLDVVPIINLHELVFKLLMQLTTEICDTYELKQFPATIDRFASWKPIQVVTYVQLKMLRILKRIGQWTETQVEQTVASHVKIYQIEAQE